MRGTGFPSFSVGLKLWTLRQINPEFPYAPQVKTSWSTLLLCLVTHQFLRLCAFSINRLGDSVSEKWADRIGIFVIIWSWLLETILGLTGIKSRLLVLADGFDYGVLADPQYVPEVIDEKIVALAGSAADPLQQIQAMRLKCTVGEEFGRIVVWNWEPHRLPWKEATIY